MENVTQIKNRWYSFMFIIIILFLDNLAYIVYIMISLARKFKTLFSNCNSYKNTCKSGASVKVGKRNICKKCGYSNNNNKPKKKSIKNIVSRRKKNVNKRKLIFF